MVCISEQNVCPELHRSGPGELSEVRKLVFNLCREQAWSKPQATGLSFHSSLGLPSLELKCFLEQKESKDSKGSTLMVHTFLDYSLFTLSTVNLLPLMKASFLSAALVRRGYKRKKGIQLFFLCQQRALACLLSAV